MDREGGGPLREADASWQSCWRAEREGVEYLNTLFGELIQGVNQHQGIANKFLGDGFMAVFGALRNDSGQVVPAGLRLTLIVPD